MGIRPHQGLGYDTSSTLVRILTTILTSVLEMATVAPKIENSAYYPYIPP